MVYFAPSTSVCYFSWHDFIVASLWPAGGATDLQEHREGLESVWWNNAKQHPGVNTLRWLWVHGWVNILLKHSDAQATDWPCCMKRQRGIQLWVNNTRRQAGIWAFIFLAFWITFCKRNTRAERTIFSFHIQLDSIKWQWKVRGHWVLAGWTPTAAELSIWSLWLSSIWLYCPCQWTPAIASWQCSAGSCILVKDVLSFTELALSY